MPHAKTFPAKVGSPPLAAVVAIVGAIAGCPLPVGFAGGCEPISLQEAQAIAETSAVGFRLVR